MQHFTLENLRPSEFTLDIIRQIAYTCNTMGERRYNKTVYLN